MIIALAGLPGSGKTTAASILEEKGFIRVSFGKITLDELKKRGLEINEENEKKVREGLRKEHGMAAFAKLNIRKIQEALKKSNVVIDDLMSYQEYTLLKENFDNIKLVAITAPEKERMKRLTSRKVRTLTPEEAKSRDNHQLNALNLKESIEKAENIIVNDKSLDDFRRNIEELI